MIPKSVGVTKVTKKIFSRILRDTIINIIFKQVWGNLGINSAIKEVCIIFVQHPRGQGTSVQCFKLTELFMDGIMQKVKSLDMKMGGCSTAMQQPGKRHSILIAAFFFYQTKL